MKHEYRQAFAAEIRRADEAEAVGDLDRAFAHLERAHIIGQRYFVTHVHSHLRMLRIARRRADSRETRGQIIRLIAVAPGYLFGWIPKGNTGGANVSAVKPMLPPPDLAPLLKSYSVWSDVVFRGALWAVAISGAVIVLNR
ncbi:MAG: DUF3703 domain-containing protein [Hyphomonadaceae bacterium]|nr:DUF3703 domain-containing protein [Hyphomonadaceae bacterium]